MKRRGIVLLAFSIIAAGASFAGAAPKVTMINPPYSGNSNLFPHYGYTQMVTLQATAFDLAATGPIQVEFFGEGMDLGPGTSNGGAYTFDFSLSSFFNGSPFTIGPNQSGEVICNFYAVATDSLGQTQSLPGSLIADFPPILAPQSLPLGTVNQPYKAQVDFANSYVSVSYKASGLPPGLSMNATTGFVTGTPTQEGVFNTTFTETNNAGTGSGVLPITIQSPPPPAPVITSAGTASGQVGVAFSYQIAATNSPTSFNATGLPTGLTLDATAGLISGTPVSSGTISIQLAATNRGGTGTVTLTLTVAPGALPAPGITSPTNAQGLAGVHFSYQIQGTLSPSQFNATGLPAGLSINTATGLISGAAAAAGTSSVTLSATNAGGTGSETLTLQINQPSAPTANAGSAAVTENTAQSIFLTGSDPNNLPLTYTITANPAHATLSGTAPSITYTPAGGYTGSDSFNFKVNNGFLDSQDATVTITVSAPPQLPPVIQSVTATPNPATGTQTTLQVSAQAANGSANLTYLWAVSGFAPGPVNFTNATAATTQASFSIVGTYPLSITVQGANGLSTTDSVTVVVSQTLSKIGINVPVQPFALNTAYTLTAAAQDQFGFIITPTPTFTWSAPGASIDANGVFTASTAGTYTVTASAVGVSASVTVTVSAPAQLPPVITNGSPTFVTDVGTAFDWWITATNCPCTFGATNLPPGLTLNAQSGLISGAPTQASPSGGDQIGISATNPAGMASATISVKIVNVPSPAVLTVGTVTGAAGTQVTLPVSFTPSPSLGSPAIGFNVVLPTGLTFISATAGAETTAVGGLVGDNPANGAVLLYNFSQAFFGAGQIVLLQLQIAPGTPPGSLPVTLTNANASDITGLISIPVNVTAGSVVVSGALATPNLSLPATMSLSDTISIDYPSSIPVSFEWTFSAEPLADQAAASRTAAFVSGQRVVAGGSQLSLASQNLSPGHYWIQVVAIDNAGGRSLPATAQTTFMSSELDAVRVYPNPWRADRPANVITFDGLSTDSTVKIFTVSGHWVQTISSSGGVATWDLRNSGGDMVASGLYIYLVTDDQGGKVHGKLAIIR